MMGGYGFPVLGVQDEGTVLAFRRYVNFIGAGVSAADNATAGTTDVTIAGAAAVTGWTDDGTTVRLTTATDVVAIGTATPTTNRKLTILETGTNAGVRVEAAAAGNNLFDAIVTADTGIRFALTTAQLAFGPGNAAVDTVLLRQAANVWEVGSGDSFFAVNAPIGRRGASADANATAQLTGSQLDLGAGGGTAVDCTLSRQAANVFELGSGDSLYSVGTATIGLRTASGDANPTVALTATGLELGAGGGSATDVAILRSAANNIALRTGGSNRWIVGASGGFNPATDNTGNLGTALLRVSTFNGGAFLVYAGAGDTNATAYLDNSGGGRLRFGINSADNLSWTLGAQAANVAELGSGDSLYSVGTATLGRRAASADANPTIALTATGLELGAGAGTATDVVLDRSAANVLRLQTGDTFIPQSTGQDLGATGTRWDVFAQDINSSGARTRQTVAKVFGDSPYAVAATDDVILYDPTGGASTVNLPTAAGITGRELTIKHSSNSANNVTIDGNGTETIDGLLTYVLAARQAIRILSDGANWHITAW